MRGRRGFLLIWANVAICVVLLMAGALAMAMQTAIRYEAASRRDTTALHVAEDAMEKMKYNARFGKNVTIPTFVSRNGSDFRVKAETGTESVSGITMKKVRVMVEDENGRGISFSCLVGRDKTEEEE